MSAPYQTPWALASLALLAGCAVADLFLRKRYAGGTGARDRRTALLLVVSLNVNLMVLLFAPTLPLAHLRATPALGWSGLALTVLGVLLRYGAVYTLGRRFTWRVAILDGHQLVQHGVFRWLRHPSYSGGLLALVGAALALGSWLPLAFLVCTHVPVVLLRIAVEEQVLADHFGQAYRAYARRSYRLLPFVY